MVALAPRSLVALWCPTSPPWGTQGVFRVFWRLTSGRVLRTDTGVSRGVWKCLHSNYKNAFDPEPVSALKLDSSGMPSNSPIWALGPSGPWPICFWVHLGLGPIWALSTFGPRTCSGPGTFGLGSILAQAHLDHTQQIMFAIQSILFAT